MGCKVYRLYESCQKAWAVRGTDRKVPRKIPRCWEVGCSKENKLSSNQSAKRIKTNTGCREEWCGCRGRGTTVLTIFYRFASLSFYFFKTWWHSNDNAAQVILAQHVGYMKVGWDCLRKMVARLGAWLHNILRNPSIWPLHAPWYCATQNIAQ